jgi:hypothetical protein
MAGDSDADRLTWWQRLALRRMHRAARKKADEPLTSEDWAVYFEMASGRMATALSSVLRALPSNPRCGICGAPFAGFGSRLIRPLGYQQSRKSPNLCAACVEASPPGGMTTEAGVLFADLRGFTSLSEETDPEAVRSCCAASTPAPRTSFSPRRLLNDFTAIGDVVNVAARLQGEAAGGEILVSSRLAERLPESPGERLELTLKGKAEPVVAYRSGLE